MLEAISLAELRAGGPGSGCRGANCGRPKGMSQEIALTKKTPPPKRVNVDFLREHPAALKIIEKQLKQTSQSALALLQKFTTAVTKDGTLVKEGDTVKIQKPVTVWNQKTGNNDKYPVGTKATIVNVLPKIGTGEQQISVQVKPHHDPTYFGANDVVLHKAAGPTTVETEPVPKSQIKQQFTSNDGAQVTIVKTQETRDYDPRTIKDLANQSSRYKGQFDQVEKVDGADGQTTRLYDTSNVPSRAWGKEGAGTAAPRPGVTLWVHRYEDHVTIQEQSYQRWGTKAKGMISWRYNNIGQAFGMLKKRYGISIPLSKERF